MDERMQQLEARKQEIIADSCKFQRVCGAYVGRNVIYCVSSLIYELREVADQLDDYDTYLTLTGGRPDYEEAARYFIMEDADLSELEEIAEQFGYWSDVVDEVKARFTQLNVPTDEDGDEIDDLDEWCDANKELLPALRRAVWDLVDAEACGPQWVCEEFVLDPDYNEPLEHWVIDRYFGRELADCGEIVEEYLGLLIWGRTCTGQAIYMDGVVENLIKNFDADHWVWGEA